MVLWHWLAGLVVLAFLIALVLKVGMRPYIHRPLLSELVPLVEALLHRGYESGYMTLAVPSRSWSLQMTKYLSGSEAGLKLGLPRGDWAHEHFDPIVQRLSKNAIEFEVQESGAAQEVEFLLVVDFGKDVQLAVQTTRLLAEMFGVGPTDRLEVKLINVSPWQETIGRV